MANEIFTAQWLRPRRKNDVIPPASNHSFWNQYPCLICGKTKHETSINPKRCSRCRSTVYCSSDCQKQDFGEGKHKAHCLALSKLWAEKERLEQCLWYGSDKETRDGCKSTNPFDDDYENPEMRNKEHLPNDQCAVVGKIWHDQPETKLQKNTTQYCVVLLQLVQLLGRAESWRVSRIVSSQGDRLTNGVHWRNKALNPLSLELALDIAFTLFYLDQTDGRVRILIPSLLLEGGYYQEAYNFMKFWTSANGCLMILDLALPGGAEDNREKSHSYVDEENQDMLESPAKWMDGEITYPSIGMVFELAYLKCHLLMMLKHESSGSEQNSKLIESIGIVGDEELKQQVNLLLSLVHKWNPHLLPKLGKESYDICFGAYSSSFGISGKSSIHPPTPPALDSLLNLHPPGFELQYSFGNPGGGSIDEAASIWQKDMILWHVMNPFTMEYLSHFCKGLENNLVDTSVLTGLVNANSSEGGVNDAGTSNYQEQRNAAEQRKEAEELVAKLQRENPDRTMDQIMMHPDMAALMIKHLHTD